MGKIGDLWVRLGLKKDQYTAGLKEAEREASGFGKGISAMSGKAKAAFALVAAGVVAVINVVKDLAKQNQSLGDAWNKLTAGMTAAWEVFKTSLAATDFSHLFSEMREATRLARELYDAMDAMGEIGTSYNITLAEQLHHINELKIRLRDVNLSEKERVEAGQELLDIYRKLEKEPTRGLGNVKDATLDYYMQRMGIDMEGFTDQELAVRRRKYIEFFKWLGTAEGQAYNDAAKKVAQSVGNINSRKGQQYMRNAANNGRAEFAALAVAYNDKMSDKDRLAVEAAVTAYYQQEAKYSGETLRIQTQINSIRRDMVKTGIAPDPEDIDAFAQELAYIKQESAELAEVRAADEAIAKAANETYAAWRAMADLPPVRPFDDGTTKALERNLQAAVRMGEELNAVEIQANSLGAALAGGLIPTLEDSLIGAFDALADVLGGVSEGGMEQVTKALLEPLADMAVRAGTLIMFSGEAIQALKTALLDFNPAAPIVAGAALVAVGLAAKAGLASIGNQGAGASSVTSYSGGNYGGVVGGAQTAELTVNVQGVVKGSEIILSGQNTLKEWGR